MFCANFGEAIVYARDQLMRYGTEINPGRWQGFDTKGKPDLDTQEILNLTLEVPLPHTILELKQEIQPNLPWADDHFDERVGRNPTNPGDEYVNWPWWQGQGSKSMDGQVFTHTYQERFWPRYAAGGQDKLILNGADLEYENGPQFGIRYEYGDLDDVVELLIREPYTRQATFPIFFPEDTGVRHEGRVPCTLHYHFMLRNGMLHLWYPIRSCDLVRHFRDDLYMAARLAMWVLEEVTRKSVEIGPDGGGFVPLPWGDTVPGHLYFTAYSFHVHRGDLRYV